MKARLPRFIGPILGVVVFGFALAALYHELHRYSPRDIFQDVADLPLTSVVAALALTALSFTILTGYDFLAVRYVRNALPYRRVALASFTGYAFSQALGFPLLTGAPVRYRMYSAWGLSTLEIAQVIFFYTLTFWLGVIGLSGAVLLAEPHGLAASIPLPLWGFRAVGIALLGLFALYLAWAVVRRGALKIRGWEVEPPPTRIALGQAVLGPLDWLAAGSVLYFLLPPSAHMSLPAFLGLFLLAQVIGLLSHVPGGLGVMEATLIFLMPERVSEAGLLGSLIAYRGIYYLAPLTVVATGLATYELRRRRELVLRMGERLGRWTVRLVPTALSITTFVAGAVLLVSGATPPAYGRLAWLARALPLPVIELSHFLASLAGAGLVILAWGIQRKLDAAYHLTAALLAAGIVFSLLKGLDYEEATLLTVMLVLLLPARPYFYRKASLLGESFSPRWFLAVGLILLGSLWLSLFAHGSEAVRELVWWRFALGADAPRSVRASVGALALALGFAAVRLMRPAPPKPRPAAREELNRAEAIVAAAPRTMANLALLGDKELLFSESGESFLMYGIEGRSWITLGDPVGREEEYRELVWRFREMTDRYDDWPVFYQVSAERLGIYLELGLTVLKLGEEGRVDLSRFSLEGHARKDLRSSVRKLEKQGCAFAVLPREEVRTYAHELRAVSDEWLAARSVGEKGFSLGYFDEVYLSHFPLAVIRRSDRVLAFANVWAGPPGSELSIDLMRHVSDAPNGTMDYLFAQLMLWGRERGYQWFNLGMAPLAGLERRRLAPIWNQLGALIFRFGEHFYSFQGLRDYKEKFDPAWEPRYLAVPGALALPRVLLNLSTLISGGLKEVLVR